MLDDQPDQEGQRRTRSSRRRGYSGGGGGGGGRRGTGRKSLIAPLFRAAWFDRAIQIIVGVAALAYVVLMIDRFHSDTVMLGFRPLQVPRSEMLYGFGRPEAVRQGDGSWVPVQAATPIDGYDLWRYRSEGGGTYLIHFDGAGLSDEISCFHPTADRGACPGSFWINVGDTEDKMAFHLGAAPVRRLNGPSALMRYPSIGVDFELQQFRIRRITIRHPKSPVLSRIPRFIRFAFP